MRKIAIIGSNSFLAKKLIDKLQATNQLFLYQRNDSQLESEGSNVSIIKFDLPSVPVEFDKLLHYDIIIYTAAAGVQSGVIESSITTYEVNLYLPLQIVQFLDASNYLGKFITFGSYFEIGDNAEEKLYDENDLLQSNLSIPNKYCDSKRLLTKFYNNRQFSISWSHLIISSLYGPGENENRLIPYVINGIRENLDLKLSSGEQIRQYLFVNDLTDLISIIITENTISDVYNISGPDDPIKIKDLIDNIYCLLHAKRSVVEQLKTRDQTMAYLGLNTDKIKKQIPAWKPKITLVEGLSQYL